jgi:arginine/lysine/ornithine decarboxylase
MEELDALLSDTNASAVYITSPDYLGNIADIRGISKVCKRYEVPLIVDNAHGAYLRFLGERRHPIDEGADMCSDSAHKTLPVLTGGAYLHISDTSPFKETFCSSARDMLSLFASTSPSYLTLASLDLCNKYVADGYRDALADTVRRIGEIKEELSSLGFSVMDTEPLKLVINTADFGYSGREISRLMSCSGIELEYADGDYAVLMITPQNTEEDFNAFLSFMRSLKRKSLIKSKEIFTYKPKSAMSFREAYFRDRETIATDKALGRICASLSVSCPPAIPIVALGEVIDGEAVALLRRYGVDTVEVVK